MRMFALLTCLTLSGCAGSGRYYSTINAEAKATTQESYAVVQFESRLEYSF